MGVLDGQPVSAAITNPAFINKNNDDSMPNILAFTRALSGASIADIQVAVNKLYTCTGASESQTGTVYSAPSNTITDGDSHQTALGELARKFNPATGHMHTGAAGDAPPISGGFITGVPFEQFVQSGGTLSSVTGSSSNVTSVLTGKTPSSSSTTLGVVVSSPYNRVLLASGATTTLTDCFVDSIGNLVYARLTYSAGTWTLSYYTLVSGSETAYTFTSAANITWYYRELYKPLVATPVYEPNFLDLEFKTVHSVAATGNNAIYGDVVFAATSGVSVTQSGQTLTFTGSLSDFYPQNVSATGYWGVGSQASRYDHVHQGIHSVAASGSATLYGDVIFQAASGVTLAETGQNLLYSADYYTSTPANVGTSGNVGTSLKLTRGDHVHQGVHSVAATGSSALFGDVVLQAASGTLISESGQNILYSVDYSTTATSVASANAPGTSLQASRGDHVHQGIHSIAATGNSALFGDVVFQAASGVLVSETGQNVLFYADEYTSTPSPIASAGSAGSSLQVAKGDHTHAGVHSIAASGYTAVLGDATLKAGTGMTISATGNIIEFISSPGTTIAASGFSALTGNVVLAGSGSVTVSEVGQVIYISSSASGGGGTGTGPLVTPNNSSGNLTMSTGFSTFWPYLNIIGTDTFTVQTGAQLVSAGVMAVTGTLTVATGGIAIVL